MSKTQKKIDMKMLWGAGKARRKKKGPEAMVDVGKKLKLKLGEHNLKSYKNFLEMLSPFSFYF